MAIAQVILSKDTLEVLRNISSINNSLKFKPGNVIKTMSPCQSILMEATIAEVLPIEFSIYELSKLLNVLGLPTLQGASLDFDDDKKVVINGGASKVSYFFTDQSFVTHPDKTVALPSIDLNVVLTATVLDGFAKAASALQHKIMALKVEGGKAFLVATTPENDTANEYTVELGDALAGEASDTVAPDGLYKLKVDNLKIIPGDYRFEVCSKGIIKVSHQTREITYYLGLERV